MNQEKISLQLQCPMPQLDFEIITLGHGSGGLLTNKLLESGVFDLLKNPLLDEHHDGAIFEMSGRMTFSTDSYVISPFFFPGGNIGELAVNGTSNDLAMCSAIPRYLSLGFILEEGLKMQAFLGYTGFNQVRSRKSWYSGCYWRYKSSGTRQRRSNFYQHKRHRAAVSQCSNC